MCRACDDANPRRCPSSSGPLRSARDRSSYAAKKAAGLTKPRRTHGPSIGNDVKGGMDGAGAAHQPPTVDELNQMISEVQHAYQGSYGSVDDVDAYSAMIDKYGSREGAVTALGSAIAERAEMHAGTTAAEVEAIQADMEERLKVGTAEMEARLGAAKNKAAIEANMEAVLVARIAGDNDKAEALKEGYWPLAHERDAIFKDPQYLELRQLQQDIQDHRKGLVGDKLRALADGYQKTLAEVRPMGGDMTFHERSAKNAAAAFNKAAQFYPTDWIEASNSRPAAIAKIVKTRAHYSEGARQVTRKKVLSERLYFAGGDTDLEQENSLWTEYERTPDKDDWGDKAYIRREFEVHTKQYDWQGGPRGRGWTEHESSTPERQVWRRPKYEMKELASERIAEITTNVDSTGFREGDTLTRVATHELGHRFQSVVPGISTLEHQFIARRTTLSDGEREAKVNVSGGKKAETGYADSFPLAYTGRVYEGSAFTEVLSTGAESLFAGEEGGLVGGGRYHRDDDMRSFILGLMASAHRPAKA